MPKMPLPSSVDAKRIVQAVRSDVDRAVKNWRLGQPQTEEALLNHLTGKLGRHRKACNVGKGVPVTAKSQLVLLHRKERNCSDKFGADLAVTLSVADTFRKTSFFQLKRGSNYKVKLKAEQLDVASVDARIKDRSVVLAINDGNGAIHIKDVVDLQDEVANNKTRTKSFDAWPTLEKWLRDWLSCDVGKPSTIGDSDSVESLLEAFIPKDESQLRRGDVRQEVSPGDVLPARVWLKIDLAKSDNT